MGAAISPAQLFAIAGFALLFAWREVRSRFHGFLLMLGWYAGALSVVPGIWGTFFHSSLQGWLVTSGLSLLLAGTYTAVPRKMPRAGAVVGILLSAVPPLGFVGMASPLLIAGAIFPGTGWWGLLGVIGVFSLCPIDARWTKPVLAVAMVAGLVAMLVPSRNPPVLAWADNTYLGFYPTDLGKSFARQDQLKAQVSDAIRAGAKLIVLPEGADATWDAGQAFYWNDVADLARRHHAQVLIGAYSMTRNPLRAFDGLIDLTHGTQWPTTIAEPVSMWRPWAKDYNFALRRPHGLMQTPFGAAAYSICYEDALVWPLAWQETLGKPKLLISAANQWFASQSLSRPQTRSIQLQARLWGLPLLRAVNWKQS